MSRGYSRPLTSGVGSAAEAAAEAMMVGGGERKEERPVEAGGGTVQAGWRSSSVCTKRWMRLVWGGREGEVCVSFRADDISSRAIPVCFV